MLFVSEDWYFRSHRMPIAKAALASDYEVYLVTNVTAPVDDLKALGIEVLPFDISRGDINPFGTLVRLMKLYKMLNSVKPDILHSVALKPVIIGALASLMVGKIRRINALAGLGYVFSSNTVKARLLRPFMKAAFKLVLNRKNSVTIVQNKDDWELLVNKLGIGNNKVSMIRGSGVNLEKFSYSPAPDGLPNVAIVARLLRDKGIYELVDAIRLLKHKGVACRLILAGDVDEKNMTSIPRSVVNEWSEEGVLEWKGHVSQVAELWKNTHICVLPSYREGLPMSLLEAAACGRPIVTTDTPGCREIVQHGVNGYLVPVRNSEKLAHYIEVLIKDRKLREDMGKASREIVVSHFSEDIVKRQTMDLYTQVLK